MKMKRFRYLPQSLQTMFLAFAAAPLGFMAYLLLNPHAFSKLPLWYVAVVAACYVVVPWILATLLIKRSPTFLYVLIGECLSLLALAFITPGTMPNGLLYVHYVFVMMMVAMALMLVNRDILFPFVFAGYRGWRRAPRVPANQRVRVHLRRLDRAFNMMVEDCSLTGLALYGSEETLDEALVAIVKGEPVVVTCNIGRDRHQVAMHYMWQSQMSGVIKLGFKAHDNDAMAELFKGLGLSQPEKTRTRAHRINEAWANRRVRRLLNYSLAVALLALMLLPPLIQAGGLKMLKDRAQIVFQQTFGKQPVKRQEPPKKAIGH